MKIDLDQFSEQGYLVLRQVIPPDQLDELRASYERLVDRQTLFCAPARHSRQLDKLAYQNAYQLSFKNGSIHSKLILVKMKLAIETLHMFIFYTGFYFQNVIITIRKCMHNS